MTAAASKSPLALLGRRVVDFVFPPHCPVCGQEILPGKSERDSGVLEIACRTCVEKLVSIPAHRCRRCSAPVGPHLDTSAGCIHCIADVFCFERVFSLGVYRNQLRAAVLSAKHAGGRPTAAALAHVFCNRSEAELESLGINLVIPIPHHWVERVVRRHLSPMTLSRVIAARLRVRWSHDVLKKVRRTAAQVSLNASERRRNLRDAFRMRRGTSVAGKTILLVDDVLTTGTTAHRATRVLKQAGAGPVYVAAIARGVSDSSGPSIVRDTPAGGGAEVVRDAYNGGEDAARLPFGPI